MIRSFGDIIGQPHAIRILSAFLGRDTIPHALLFTGVDGTGKRTAALAFAMACNCTGLDRGISVDPCGACRSCGKIASGNHPDIHLVAPKGAYLRIDQVRALGRDLALKPYEARVRVAILSDAHAMNPEAGNALLKLLEEPPDRTILILTAPQASDLLPTIVSRCQPVRFNPIPPSLLKDHLTDRHDMGEAEASVTAMLAGGSLARALSMKGSDAIRRRAWLLGEMTTLSEKPISSLMALAEKLSGNKETLQDHLEIIASWFRDLVVHRYAPDNLLNRDLAGQIGRRAESDPVPVLLGRVGAIQAAQRNLRSNANARLTLEVLLLQLAGALPVGTPIPSGLS